MRVGITGHQNIPDEALGFIENGIVQIINKFPMLIGVSSLAVGTDQMFASLILQFGGRLHVILPCEGYDRTFSDIDTLNRFKHLLSKAEYVEKLEYTQPSEEAFLNAGRRIVDLSDFLVAVWDGQKARGKGGTGDIVYYAKQKGIKIAVIWPDGVIR